jgi:hypothetical protein
MSTRGLVGIAWLALAVVFLAVAGWRGYIRYAGESDHYLLVSVLGPAVADLPPAKQAEFRQKIVSRGRKAEGVIATWCLIAAGVLAAAGCRRLRPVQAAKASGTG